MSLNQKNVNSIVFLRNAQEVSMKLKNVPRRKNVKRIAEYNLKMMKRKKNNAKINVIH